MFELQSCHRRALRQGDYDTTFSWGAVNYHHDVTSGGFFEAKFYHNEMLIGAWDFEEEKWDMLPELPTLEGPGVEDNSWWFRQETRSFTGAVAREFQDRHAEIDSDPYQVVISPNFSNWGNTAGALSFERTVEQRLGVRGVRSEIKFEGQVVFRWNFDERRWDLGPEGANVEFPAPEFTVNHLGVIEDPSGEDFEYGSTEQWLAWANGTRSISENPLQNFVSDARSGAENLQILAGDFRFQRTVHTNQWGGTVSYVEAEIESKDGRAFAQWDFDAKDWVMAAGFDESDKPNFKLDAAGSPFPNDRAFDDWAEPDNFLDEELLEGTGLTVGTLGWILLALVVTVLVGGIFLRRRSGSKTKDRVGNVASETQAEQQPLGELAATRGPASPEKLGGSQETEANHKSREEVADSEEVFRGLSEESSPKTLTEEGHWY